MDELTAETPASAAVEIPATETPVAYCTTCGRGIPADANFCAFCGGRTVVGTSALAASGKVPWTFLDMGKTIGFVIAGTLLSFIPLFVVLFLAFGTDPDEEDPTYLTVSIASSVILQILMLIGVVRWGIGKYHAGWKALGIRKPERGGWWLPFPVVFSAFGLMFAYFAVIGALGFEPDTDLPDGTFDNIGPIIAVAVLSLAFAPFVEEIFFRGYIFGGLRNKWGGLWAALASGLLFGMVHAANPGSFYIVPPIAAIGALFAWAYIYSGSLFASIGAHFLFNLTSFVIGITTE